MTQIFRTINEGIQTGQDPAWTGDSWAEERHLRDRDERRQQMAEFTMNETPQSNALAVRETTAVQQVSQAKNIAGLCRDIVLRTKRRIQNRDYVQVEGWQSIATAHGCSPSVELVEPVEGGVRAVAVLRKISDGTEVARAEGFVGDDERMWQQRPMYARRAMAQTRAISRVCRSAFAHVVVLMDANLETTPAEEIPEHDEPAQARTVATKVVDADLPPGMPFVATTPRGEDSATFVGDWRKVAVHFGKNKGKPLGELPPRTLSWYQNEWQPRPREDGTLWTNDKILRAALDASKTDMAKPGADLELEEQEVREMESTPGQSSVPF